MNNVPDYALDVLLVAMGFNTANTLWRRSALIHEAVRVRTDMRARSKPLMQDEVLAYIVQAVYLRFGGLHTNNYPGATDHALLPAALSVADTLLTGNQVTFQQEAALETAIRAKPEYVGIVGKTLHADAVRPLRH
jgi:hypothetical protein